MPASSMGTPSTHDTQRANASPTAKLLASINTAYNPAPPLTEAIRVRVSGMRRTDGQAFTGCDALGPTKFCATPGQTC